MNETVAKNFKQCVVRLGRHKLLGDGSIDLLASVYEIYFEKSIFLVGRDGVLLVCMDGAFGFIDSSRRTRAHEYSNSSRAYGN